LDDVLDILENLHFDQQDIDFLVSKNFDPDFIRYLKIFRFQGDIYAMKEGEIVFPTCPILTVEANIIEAQIIETLLLNLLNFQTLIATKASRMRQVAGNRLLMDYGLRRAQGVGGYHAARAAMVGGFEGTSNVRAGRDYNIPVSGTMAHSFVQSYDNELAAFRDFATKRPDHCVLLVDTYSSLESGVPNAIAVAKEMQAKGHQLYGIRLDSGDLAYIAKKARQMLDDAGLHEVKIIASNQLDEFVIKSLLEQKAPIDAFGVGTNLVIGKPDAALDGVYKLAHCNSKSRIKLSETITKINLPNKKQAYRVLDHDSNFLGADIVMLRDEQDGEMMYHPFEPASSFAITGYEKETLLQPAMKAGKRLFESKNLSDIAEYSQQRLSLLPDHYKRFRNPHVYKVGLSHALKTERDELIRKLKKGYK